MSGGQTVHQLGRNADGATAVEFALISPLLVVVLMGLFDMGYTLYADVMLQGSLQEAARLSTVEGASSSLASIDAAVEEQVVRVVPGADLTFTRKAYSNFSDVGTAEDYTDTNGNGACDAGEPYEDANGNGAWDRDRGVAGLGGARDAVLYKVAMSYRRPFPMASLLGFSDVVSAEASTVLRNQPYDLQRRVARLGNCT